MAGAYQVTHERTVGRGEGVDEHEQERRYAAHNIGDGKRAFAVMLHRDEKDKPTAEGEAVLYHNPNRYAEDLLQHLGVEVPCAEQPVFPVVDVPQGIYHEEKHRHGFRNGRGYRRALYPQRRTAQFPEDEDVIQHHIGPDHHQRVGGQYLRMRGPDVEGAEHGGNEREEETIHAPVDVSDCRTENRIRFNQPAQQQRRIEVRRRKKHPGEQDEEERPLDKHLAYLRVIALAVPTCYQDLRSDAEPESQHIQYQVVDARQCRGAKLDLAHPAQVGRIRESNQMLHQEADHHGKCYRQYLAVRIFRFLCHNLSFYRFNSYYWFIRPAKVLLFSLLR